MIICPRCVLNLTDDEIAKSFDRLDPAQAFTYISKLVVVLQIKQIELYKLGTEKYGKEKKQ